MEIVKKVHWSLLAGKKTVAVAESCSGGLLSKLLTDTPGSSHYFILGIIAYSNQAKQELLGIPRRTLKRYGAVSAPVARAMAQNVRKISHTDFGIAITGIAGPKGATALKPVGTVFIAVAAKNKTRCKKFLFKGARAQIRLKSALKSLTIVEALTRAKRVP